MRSLCKLAGVIIVSGLAAGCGGGDLSADFPKDAANAPRPELTDAQKEMKKKMENQKGPAPVSARGLSDAQKAMRAKMQRQGK